MAAITTKQAKPYVWRSCKAALLSGVALGVVYAVPTRAQQAPDSQAAASDATAGRPAPAQASATENVIVTAQRRTQNLQDVPISIQVLGGAALKRLNIENLDDLLQQLPNVTAGGIAPGQDNIYIRGLALGTDGSQESGIIGSFPNVAVYLDDQSAQVPGRNLDIYAVDLQQVEVLEGPQGTLFGSGAQAGVLRYITNKPDLNKFGGNVDLGGALTAHGDPSRNIDATINIPVVQDKFAIRLTAYDDDRGGYINNVPGTFARQSSDIGIHYAGYTNNVPGPPNATNSINNFRTAKNAINPVRYEGFRGEAMIKFDDDWNALLTESVQRLDTHGVFYEEPFTSGSHPQKLPDLSVQAFEPSFNEDQFENTALTINGRVGFLKLVYDGAYLIRHTTQQQDYTTYARGVYGDYYQCQGPNKAHPNVKPQCFSPGATWNDHEQDSHLSQEFRVSTPDEWRFRAIGGFYYEDFKVAEQTNFDYLTDTANFTQIGPLPVAGVSDPNVRSPNTGFFTDATRGYRQYAIFGSADFDIIPHVLTATFGTRWFDFYDYEQGYVAGSFGCSHTGPYSSGYTGPPPCLLDNHHNLTSANLQTRSYGFRNRANLTYKVTPDIMLYYTYSEGYRPPGFNRQPPVSQGELGDIGFASDSLINNEIGYKASFFNHRLILDGAFYKEEWDSTQATVFAPGVLGNLAFTVNGPNFRVYGTEIQATGRPIDDLTLNASVALNDSKQLNAPGILAANGGTLPGSSVVFAPSGGTLAQAPAFKTVFRARYQWSESPYLPYVQFVLSHSSHERSNIGGDLYSPGDNAQDILINNFKRGHISAFYQEPITKLDISAGASFGNWSASAYIDNITDERGQEFITGTQFVESVVVDRPLTGGVRLGYKF